MKKLSIILVLTLILSVIASFPILAAETQSGNAWVYDEPGVISPETEEYIRTLNEDVFSQYASKPQLAFIIINDLPYAIERYANDMFNEFGIGTAEENRGLLFVFAINDREYALEIGDGFEKGTILREEMSDDFITEEMKDNLRAGNYDLAVRQVAAFLAGKMSDEEAGLYAAKEAQREQERIEEEKRREQAAAELAEDLKVIGIGGAILLAVIAAGVAIGKFITNARRKKTIANLMDKHKGLLWAARINKERFAAYLLARTTYDSPKEIETQFIDHAYAYYRAESIAKIQKNEKPELQDRYIQEFKRINSIEAFAAKTLTDIYDIVKAVDKEEARRAETIRQNQELVRRFWETNHRRIDSPEIREKVEQALQRSANNADQLTTDALEKVFVTTMNDATFENEVNKFIKTNQDEVNTRDFDANSFIRELKNTNEYRDYKCGQALQQMWIMYMLTRHISKRKEDRLAEERRAEERRRREEKRRREEEAAQARKAAESLRNNNSSFGSSFGGGRSSGGGGFKGGW